MQCTQIQMIENAVRFRTATVTAAAAAVVAVTTQNRRRQSNARIMNAFKRH